MSNRQLYQNALLITMDKERRITEGDLLVENGIIKEIKNKITPPENTEKIDLSNKWILPGFIQGHVHLCQTLFRNQAEGLPLLQWLQQKIWPFEGAHTKKTIRVSAQLGLAEMIRSGTTTILDMGTVHHEEEIFRVVDEVGIRGFFGKALMDQESVPNYLRETREDGLKESLRLINKWHDFDNGRLKYALAPRFVLSCTEKLWREVGEISKQNNLLIHTHAAENREETEFVKQLTGMGNISYFHKLGLTGRLLALAHCIWIDDKELEILSSTKTRVLHCPTTNLKLGSGVAQIKEFIDAEVPLLIGSDGAPGNNRLDILSEMKLANLLQLPSHGAGSISAQEIIEMATINGAKALGIENRVGSIEIGKEADFIVIDPNTVSSIPNGEPYQTIIFSIQPSNIESVFVRGKPLLQNGILKTISEKELLLNAKEAWNIIKSKM